MQRVYVKVLNHFLWSWYYNKETDKVPEVIIFFMLNSTEHEISAAHKKTKIPINEDVSCLAPLRCCIYHANKCGILTFMSRINFVLSWVEHEKSFITSAPGLTCFVRSSPRPPFCHQFSYHITNGLMKSHVLLIHVFFANDKWIIHVFRDIAGVNNLGRSLLSLVDWCIVC